MSHMFKELKTEHIMLQHGKYEKEQYKISRNENYNAWKIFLIGLTVDYTLEKKKLVNLKI